MKLIEGQFVEFEYKDTTLRARLSNTSMFPWKKPPGVPGEFKFVFISTASPKPEEKTWACEIIASMDLLNDDTFDIFPYLGEHYTISLLKELDSKLRNE